jgi:prevent-host-death family protein
MGASAILALEFRAMRPVRGPNRLTPVRTPDIREPQGHETRRPRIQHSKKRACGLPQLRASLPSAVRRVRAGGRITVTYRSRPAFRIVPVEDAGTPHGPLGADPLYRAEAVGRSRDGVVKPLFVDTAGWVACAHAADPAYKPARAARDSVLRLL